MRKMLIIGMVLLLVIILALTGCNTGTSTSTAPTNPYGDFEKIGIMKVDATQLSPTYSAYNNTWSAIIGETKTCIELNFNRKIIGTTPLRGGASWDFSIFSSKVAGDYNDPVKDLSSFNQKVIDLPDGKTQNYLFLQPCRVLIRAYDTVTKKEVDSCFLEIRKDPVPEIANLQISMTVTNGANGAGEARQIATIIVRNSGTATAKNVVVKLGPNWSFTDAIEASVSWDYSKSTSSGPKTLDPNVIYELGKTTVVNNGGVNIPNVDALVTSGLELAPIPPAEAVCIKAVYMTDPDIPGAG